MIEKGYMFTKGASMYAVTGSAVSGATGEILYLCQELREGGKLIAWPESAIREKHTSGGEVQKTTPEVQQSTIKEQKTAAEVQKTVMEEKKTAKEEAMISESEMSELEAFLETDSCVRKLEILQHMRSRVTVSMLDAMSISLDLENETGSLEEKYYCVERYLKMRIRYEGRR